MGGIRGKNKEMPPYKIIENLKTNSFFIRWWDDEMVHRSFTLSYNNRDKNEVYRKMEDMRYNLMTEWLGKKRGLFNVSTNTD